MTLPRCIWTWTSPPPHGKRVQVWLTDDVDVDVSDLTDQGQLAVGSGPVERVAEPELEFACIAVPRVTTPTMEAVQLAALLVECADEK